MVRLRMGVGVRRFPMLVSHQMMSTMMGGCGQGFIGAGEASDAREQ
jgi:hypothetical protein